jgi:hypothetical protein
MDATADLTLALAEWRRLTALESEAILNDNWQEVADQQSRKARLQAEIQRVLRMACSPQFPQALSSWAMQGRFDSTVSELMALERHNGNLLAAKRKRRQAESERLAMTLRDLQGVRRAYGGSQGAYWQSYS